jgi:hypothetical protein
MSSQGFSNIIDGLSDEEKHLAACADEVRERWHDPVLQKVERIALQPLIDEGGQFIRALRQADEVLTRALRQLEE